MCLYSAYADVNCFSPAYVEDAVWELGDALVEERDFGPMIELMAKTRSTAGSEEVLGVCFSMLLSRVEVDDPIVNEHIEVSGHIFVLTYCADL